MFHAILVVTVTDAGCEVADEAALCRAHRDAGTAASFVRKFISNPLLLIIE